MSRIKFWQPKEQQPVLPSIVVESTTKMIVTFGKYRAVYNSEDDKVTIEDVSPYIGWGFVATLEREHIEGTLQCLDILLDQLDKVKMH